MFAGKGSLIIFGIFVLASARRVVRSPDKLEVDIPNYSPTESGEYQDNMNEEAAYWQGQGDKVADKEEEGQQQLEQDREKNQENYEHEKDHLTEEQQNYNKEVNETYQEEKENAQAHQESNQEHYAQNPGTTPDFPACATNPAEDLTETEIGDRYEEKGTEYKEEGQDKIENYDVSKDSPSFSYTRN